MIKVLVLGVAAALAMNATALAQTDFGLEITDVDVSAFPEVRIEVSVPAAIADAKPGGESFSVIENGSLVGAAVFAPAETVTEVVLVVDTSGSMRGEPLDAAIAAATAFIERLPDAARTGLVTTGATATVVVGVGAADLPSALDELTADGETALFDGVVAGAGLFDSDPSSRAILVVLSDGADTVSTSSENEAAAAARRDAIEFYAVRLTSPEGDPEALDGLAQPDHPVITAGADGLVAAYEAIADDVLGRYRLAYVSDAAGPTEIFVRIEVAGTVLFERVTVELPDASASTPTPTSPQTARVTTTLGSTAPREATPIEPVTVAEPTGVAAPWTLPAGIAAVFTGMLFIVVLTLRSAPSAREKMADLAPTVVDRSRGLLSGVARRAESIAQDAIDRTGQGGLERQLDRAGLKVRPSEYVVGGAALAIAATAAGSMIAGGVGGIFGGAAGVIAPRFILRSMVQRRRGRFTDQLEGTLQIIGGSLRAGYGLLQSIRTVADEAESPTSEEFERVVTEHRLGRPLTDSLGAMAERLEDEDLRWVVEAIDIQQDVGGDLAEVLDTVSATIRDRNQIRRQISALSAEGKMSAGILIALPFGIAALIGTISPDYLSELVGTGVGRVMLAAGMVLMGLGTMWIRKIVKVVF